MKMIAGAAALAWSKRSRTRLAPTPTIISMNSDARDREERHVGLAGHRAGQQRLAGAGRAEQQHALGDRRRRARGTCRGCCRKSTISIELVLGLVDAGDVVERGALVASARSAWRASGRAPPRPPAPPRRRRGARARRRARPAAASGRSTRSSVASAPGPASRFLASTTTPLACSSAKQLVVGRERRPDGLEVLVGLLVLARADRLLELALDLLAAPVDLQDVAGVDLVEEERVGDVDPRGPRREELREQDVEREEREDEVDPAAAERRPAHAAAVASVAARGLAFTLHPPGCRALVLLRGLGPRGGDGAIGGPSIIRSSIKEA